MAVVCLFVTMAFMKKYDSSKAKILFLCLLLCVVGVSGVAFEISKPTIVIFNVLYTMARIIPDNLNSQKRMGIVRITGKLKYALEHNMRRYNFYGITGNFDEKTNPFYGLYSFLLNVRFWYVLFSE